MGDVIVSGAEKLETGYAGPTCSLTGTARSARFQPDGYSLWRVRGELDAGAELTWDEQHGDEGIYVLAGEVTLDSRRVTAGGAGIVESGVPARLQATVGSAVLHFGPVAIGAPHQGLLGAPEPDGHRVHVYETVQDSNRTRSNRTIVETAWFGDGSCPTCRIALFIIDARARTEPHVSVSHVHSADEIIHVLDGELRVGRLVVPAGTSIAVPGGQRYGFRTDGAYRFVNYRRDISTIQQAPDSEPVVETRDAFVAAGIMDPISS
jgi:quercetin dioxygenase-like cupin family protein